MASSDHNWLMLVGGSRFRLASGLSVEKEAALLSAAVEFVNVNGLVAQAIPFPPQRDWEGFELRRSQLTNEGFAFLSKQLAKWLGGIDRGKDPSDISSMNRALTKFRGAR